MQYWGVTDQGRIRKNNQDSFSIIENNANNVLAIVCDGIGGARHGDWASNLVCEKLAESFCDSSAFSGKQSAKKWFKTNLQAVNELIYERSLLSADCRGMGTTAVGLICYKNGILVANCGDSRCYQYEKEELSQVTSDHTVIADLICQGAITAEEARTHPKRHILSRAIGADNEVKIDFFDVAGEAEFVLLCSDGLTGLVSDEEIKKVLGKRGNCEKKAKELLEIANNKGGYDNITVVLLKR